MTETELGSDVDSAHSALSCGLLLVFSCERNERSGISLTVLFTGLKALRKHSLSLPSWVNAHGGFQTLPMEDQITLIKETRSQLLFAASHIRCDIENKCFIGQFNRIELYQIPPQ